MAIADDVKAIFDGMPAGLNPEAAKGMSSVIQFNLTGDGGGNYHVVIKDGACSVVEGTHASPNMTMTIAAQDYVDMISGKLNGQMAFMSGKLKIAGDMGLAMKMQTLFKRPEAPAAAAPAAAAPAAAAPAPAAPAAAAPAPAAPAAAAPAGVAEQVKTIFDGMSTSLNPDAAKGMNAAIQFNLTGDGGGNYHVVIKDGACSVVEGTHASPNMTMTMAAQDYVDMINGKLNGQMAFMSGKLKIAGDMGLAMKMQTLFKRPA
jgi:putative sterol carrier protein